MPGEFVYFVVVGNNFAVEGSYGMDVVNQIKSERPEAVGVVSCDRPQ
jgi:hypothetical protein